jgi:hypothetical protein
MARHERLGVPTYGGPDTIDGTSEAPVATNNPGPLTRLSDVTRKGVSAMLTDSMPEVDLASLQNQCVEFLRVCREDASTLTHTRLYFIQKAREYGLTHKAIGDALGITEGAVRGLLNRAAK